MVFRLNRNNDAVIRQECLSLCSELKKLTKKEVLYIILAYDYDSPYHQFSADERKKKAYSHAYNNEQITDKFEAKKKMYEGIELYKSLQFDVRRETSNNYKLKIIKLNQLLDAENNPTKIKAIMESIKRLQIEVDNMEKEISKAQEDDIEIKGGGSLSLIEKLQENINQYNLHKDHKPHAIDIETPIDQIEEI